MFKLVIEDDDGRATEIPLVRDEVTIGRKEGNTVRLPDQNVSRRHARLYKSNGHIWLEDAGSRYGIRVNGTRLTDRVQLAAGDHIQIGDYQIALQLEGAATEPVAPRPVPRDDDDAVDTAVIRVDQVRAPAPPAAPKPVEEEAPAQLIVISSNVAKLTYDLHLGETVIGREGDVNIEIDHVSISRSHAKIRRSGRRFSVIDLGASNAVKVNGEECGARDLRNGDVIHLGDVKLRFVKKDETGDLERAVEQYHERKAGQQATRVLVGLVLAVIVVGGAFAFVMVGDTETPAPPPAVARPPAAPAAEAASPAPAAREASAAEPNPAVEPDAPPPTGDPLTRGQALMGVRDWMAAVQVLEGALREDPANAELERLRNKARIEQLNKATFEELKRAIERKDFDTIDVKLMAIPKDSAYRADAKASADEFLQQRLAHHVAEAGRLEAEGKLRAAKRAYETALTLDEEHLEAKRGLFLLNQRTRREAGARAKSERSAAAKRRATAASAADSQARPAPAPKTGSAPEAAPGRVPRAQEPASAPKVEDNKRQAMAMYLQGRRLMRTDKAAGVRKLVRALKLYPKLAGANKVLGNHYAEEGNPKKACRYLKKFLRLSPKNPQADAIRGTLRKFGCGP